MDSDFHAFMPYGLGSHDGTGGKCHALKGETDLHGTVCRFRHEINEL